MALAVIERFERYLEQYGHPVVHGPLHGLLQCYLHTNPTFHGVALSECRSLEIWLAAIQCCNATGNEGFDSLGQA